MKDFLWRLFDWVVGAFIGVCIYLLIVCDKPTAIDVYRGKTTLEITYRDCDETFNNDLFVDSFRKAMEE